MGEAAKLKKKCQDKQKEYDEFQLLPASERPRKLDPKSLYDFWVDKLKEPTQASELEITFSAEGKCTGCDREIGEEDDIEVPPLPVFDILIHMKSRDNTHVCGVKGDEPVKYMYCELCLARQLGQEISGNSKKMYCKCAKAHGNQLYSEKALAFILKDHDTTMAGGTKINARKKRELLIYQKQDGFRRCPHCSHEQLTYKCKDAEFEKKMEDAKKAGQLHRQKVSCSNCGEHFCANPICKNSKNSDTKWSREHDCVKKELDESDTHAYYEDMYKRGKMKPCPNCYMPIEKNEGCDHITCGDADWRHNDTDVRISDDQRKCYHEFCWKCLEPYPCHWGCRTLTWIEIKKKLFTDNRIPVSFIQKEKPGFCEKKTRCEGCKKAKKRTQR